MDESPEKKSDSEPQELLGEFKELLSSVADAVGKSAVLPSVNLLHSQWKDDVSKLLKTANEDHQVRLEKAEKTVEKLSHESELVAKRLGEVADTHAKTSVSSIQALKDACRAAENVVSSYAGTASGAQLAATELSEKMRAVTETAEKVLARSEQVFEELNQDSQTILAESTSYIELAKASVNEMTAMLKTAADAQTEYAKAIEQYSAAYYDKLEKANRMFRGARRWLIFLSLLQFGVIAGALYWIFFYVVRR